MKKIIPIIAIILILFTILSCDSSLQPMEEGNVNYNIYPYLKFTLSPDRTYFIASVVEGARVTKISVPGFVHTDSGAMPVKEFAGFEDINDSINLKEVILDVHIEKVSEGAFDKAENLKVVKTSGDKEDPKWAHLPTLTREGYHFIGWKAGDTFVYNGMPIDPENSEAVPVWSELIHFEAKESTHTEEGNIEYWMCKDCGKLFLDSYATKETESVTIPTTGHEFGDWYVYIEATCTEDGEERRECSLCDYYESRRIEATGHTYGGWRDTEKPGMSKERECSVCHHIEYTLYEHIWEKVEAVEPSCTEDGNREYWKCIFHEGEFTFDPDNPVPVSMEDIIISRTGHHPDHISRKEPTCTETGNIEYWHCPDCGSFFTDEECLNGITADRIILPALGHTFPLPPEMSDYSHDDYDHWLYCERCKKEFHIYSSGSLTEGRQNHIWGEPEVCDDGLHYVRTCTVCGTIKNEDVPTDKKYEVSIGEITIRLPESPPCGDMTINGSVVADKGSSVITDGTVRIGFAPHVNSNLNYSLTCWYVRNGRTVYLDESDGTFSLTLSGPYQYTIVIQAYNEGGSIAKEYSVRL